MPDGLPTRILHVDGDSYFASCEIALNPELEGKPIWVGGGRNGNGIVIAANRIAKKFGVETGMACFQAKHNCPTGILCPPHFEEYRKLSEKMFKILEQYSPVLVPISIDEGFLDLTGMDQSVFRNNSAAAYVQEIRDRIWKELHLPVSAGLANSSRLAKLATDAGKPGFLEVPFSEEKAFLKDRPLRELSGIGERREQTLADIGAKTFGDIAAMPAMLLHSKFGIWGQELWLLASGLLNEPLILETNVRTTISSSTTLPEDMDDYNAILTFTLSESSRLMGQLRREQLLPKELALTVRFFDFTETGGKFKLNQPQFRTAVVGKIIEDMFWKLLKGRTKPVRQVRISMDNLYPFETQPNLWGTSLAGKIAALDKAEDLIHEKLGQNSIMTGAQFALASSDKTFSRQKAKCPFVPKREMIEKLHLADNKKTS